MEYSNARSAANLQSPTNHESVQNYVENPANNHLNDVGGLSPAQFGIYDEIQQHHYQYQNQAPSLNQLLQNNQYGPYGNHSLRPPGGANYHGNYWNLPARSQNEVTRNYYSQYSQDSYPQHGNDVAYSKIDKIKSSGEIDVNYLPENRSYSNEEVDKPTTVAHDWKVNNNNKTEALSPKDNSNKPEIDKKIDKSNSIEMSDPTSTKSVESHLNTDYNSNTSCVETSDKNDVLYHNSNYPLDNKINQSQLKHPNQIGYENANYGQMMMHPNANYYSHLRYPNPQNNSHNYINPGNNPMMTNSINRPPMVNYPPYMQSPSPASAYGYQHMAMHQVRPPYNVHTPFVPRSSQPPFSGHHDVYMNGTVPPQYSGVVKDPSERKEEVNQSVVGKQEASDSGSTSNKSATARSSSKSKNAIKSESHPTTPVSNTIPSPSQTSMSSIIDENDDSVSSLGPNDSNIIHHPVSQFNQHQINPNMSQNPSMMYSQSYSNNNSNSNPIPHPNIGQYPSHMGPQQRPFAPSPNMIPNRQFHHQNDSQINNSCFQKLLELGTEPERGPWVERYLKFMQENNTPLGAVPTVVKQPLDLFRLYHAVRERGGLLNVVKTKRWKEICHMVNVNASASGAYTLRRNYIKCLLDYECRFDRNGVDPGPILHEIQSLSDKKKKSTTRTTGSSSSSTISSGPASQHNSEFCGNPSTPRPSLPPPDFNSPHSFPGHSPYGGSLHNGSLMHRGPMHYPSTPRVPYPGPYPGPRIMGGFNAPSSPIHQQVRYDSNIPPNWNKPLPMNQQQWPSPSSNSSSTHPMQMPMSPGASSNSVSNSSQQPQQIGSLQEHTRRMEWKSNYGGMPPPPPPPPNGQASTRGILPPIIPNTSQMGIVGSQYHSSMPHCNYPNQTHASSFNQQRPMNPQLRSNMIPQNRHMSQTAASTMPDQMNYLNKTIGGSVPPSSVPNSIHNLSSTSCQGRSQLDNARLTQSYPSPFTYSKSSSNSLKRYDHLFPPNCVEATLPDYSKKRKYSSKDIKAFNPITVTMALKSGLVAEVSWALNYLNIWSRDDTSFDKFILKNIMPLFQALIDVWRHSLGAIFGYDLFIKDLELPITLENQISKSDLKTLLNKIDSALNIRQTARKHESTEIIEREKEFRNTVEEKIKIIKEKAVELLDCGKYNKDKSGVTVKLDYSCQLDSVISGRVDFINFITKSCFDDNDGDDDGNNIAGDAAVRFMERKCPSLSELWEVGGSDSTFHIMPPMLSQKGSVLDNRYVELLGNIDDDDGSDDDNDCESDNCGPPEIKRSRCGSPPLTPLRSSSPTLPILLTEISEEPPRFPIKSEIVSDGESLLFEIDDESEEKMLRCLCASTIIRNLSFVAGNDRIMATNRSLLVILGRLMLLGHHSHGDGDDDDERGEQEEVERGRWSCWWWLRWIDDIREHVLVTLVNVSSFLELELYPESIVRPIVTGLLHWLTCQSVEAEDALPSHRVLGCRRLSLECLMRLCVHDNNIDFIMSTSNSTVHRLFDFLSSCFCHPEVQVVKEMSLAVMHYLSADDTGCLYLAQARPSVVGGLISFIEVTEAQIRHVVENMGMEALQARPELMGTSLEFLRHSGALLNRIASHEANLCQFSRDHEMRMLNLVISTVLDQTVAQSISAVLFMLSNSNHHISSTATQNSQNNFRSFLTFDDLSFCEKEDDNSGDNVES